MDPQRQQQYVPLPPPQSVAQNPHLASLPPPPPRHPPTQTPGAMLPPPPGPPPNAHYGAPKFPNSQFQQPPGVMAWQPSWARQPVQAFPPPPPPPAAPPANQTQPPPQHLAYSRPPASSLSIPPPPPPENQPLTSATYFPGADSYGPPSLFDPYPSRPQYEPYGPSSSGSDRPRPYQPYDHSVGDFSSHNKREGYMPVTPSRSGPNLALHDNVHELTSPGLQVSTSQPADLSKSSSHRHNNSSASLGGMSPSEAAVQWPLDRVLSWLAKNGFSANWQETFKTLEIHGADFIELGHGANGRGNFGMMHQIVYPQLAKDCEKSGTGWDPARERDEGKRMRKLIRQIHENGNQETVISTPKHQQEPLSAVGGVSDRGAENSPRLAPESAAPPHSAVDSSPGLKVPHQGYNPRSMTGVRSVTMPAPSNLDASSSLDPNSSEVTTWLRADHKGFGSTTGGDHRRQSPSMSSDNGFFHPRPFEDSPKSGSPAAQFATLAPHGPSSSTSDLSGRYDHSRGNSSDSTARGRYYERKQGDYLPRPSPQDRTGNNADMHTKEQNRLLKIFKKRPKASDSSHPSPEDQFLESPTSPIIMRPNYGHMPYRAAFNASDMSLGEGPRSGTTSDNERQSATMKPVQKSKKWIFATLDGLNFRLINITDMDSVETLRHAICQNLGVSDWSGAQIFITEPGQTEHEEPLNDTMLTVNQRTKSDSLGSLKFYVRPAAPPPTAAAPPPAANIGTLNSPHFNGLGVSFPDKPAASPTTGPHQVHRKPLDDEALSRISPHQLRPPSPRTQQQTRSPSSRPPTRDASQPRLSPDKPLPDTGHSLDPEKSSLLLRQEEYNREVERKQKAYHISKVPPPTTKKDAAYGETGYRRKDVIDFDSPRLSPYEDKKGESLVPFRKPPSAPQESNTLTKVNSLRRRDSERPRIQPAGQTQSHGLGAALASMGRMTTAIGTPVPSGAEGANNSPSKGTPDDETKGAQQSTSWKDGQKTPASAEKSPDGDSPRPGLQSRKSYGPNFDFEESTVSFERTPELQQQDDDDDDSDDDSDDGLFAVPLANNSNGSGDKEPVEASSETQKATKPSLTVDTEPKGKGLSVSFKTPSTSSESFANGSAENRDKQGPFSGMAESPDDDKSPENDTFSRDVWASRPPVEGVIDHLDDFFPNVDLDAPYLEGQGTSPPSSPASKNQSETDAARKEKHEGHAYAAQSNQDGESTMKPSDPGIIARRNINRGGGAGGGGGGGLTRMRSIREVAKGANQTSRTRSVASSGNQKSGDILRRKSTKMFGAKIMQIRPGSRVNSLDPIPQSKPSQGHVPQRQPTFRIIRGQLIGKGTFGRVYLGMNADNGEVLAVKQVDINPRLAGQDRDRVKEMVGALNQEIDTMQHLEHPNIVQYLGCERGELSISIYLEYISGGSVGSCLRKHGKFEESVVKSLTHQTLSGLAYLHHQGILHRDLKADNVLLDLDGSCRISDFGISKKTDDIYGNDSTNSMQGSVFWMAPEVIQSQGQGYSAKVDIWSLGCVVLEMFAGRRPWSREEAIGAIFKLGSLNQAPPIPDDVSMNISPAALGFMYDCFTVNSAERPTAETLLTHAFCIPDPNYRFVDTELHAKIRHVLQ